MLALSFSYLFVLSIDKNKSYFFYILNFILISFIGKRMYFIFFYLVRGMITVKKKTN